MPYPRLKRLSLHVPILGRVVQQRDELRALNNQLTAELGQLTIERDQLRKQLDEELAILETILGTVTRSQDSPYGVGYCHCCRRQSVFEILGSWLRDEYLCLRCRSIPRQRHLQHILDTHFPGWEQALVHESSPTNDFLSRWCKNYSSSQYFDGVHSGESVDGVRCEDLEKLSFADESIDIFATQDVFEHVFHPELAAKEIARVLKPGGAHVFTVPRLHWVETSKPRARLTQAGIEYLEEPSYHGNPVGDGKALVTWDYGQDFENLIEAWSGLKTTTYNAVDRSLGIDGEFREVFVSRKPA